MKIATFRLLFHETTGENMSISGIGGGAYSIQALLKSHNRQNMPNMSVAGGIPEAQAQDPVSALLGGSNAQAGSGGVEQQFLSFMKETPAQRMEETWLAAHGISKADFDKMSAPFPIIQQNIHIFYKKNNTSHTKHMPIRKNIPTSQK